MVQLEWGCECQDTLTEGVSGAPHHRLHPHGRGFWTHPKRRALCRKRYSSRCSISRMHSRTVDATHLPKTHFNVLNSDTPQRLELAPSSFFLHHYQRRGPNQTPNSLLCLCLRHTVFHHGDRLTTTISRIHANSSTTSHPI